jgi:hypothetical protein
VYNSRLFATPLIRRGSESLICNNSMTAEQNYEDVKTSANQNIEVLRAKKCLKSTFIVGYIIIKINNKHIIKILYSWKFGPTSSTLMLGALANGRCC